jgi:hypothetical protein
MRAVSASPRARKRGRRIPSCGAGCRLVCPAALTATPDNVLSSLVCKGCNNLAAHLSVQFLYKNCHLSLPCRTGSTSSCSVSLVPHFRVSALLSRHSQNGDEDDMRGGVLWPLAVYLRCSRTHDTYTCALLACAYQEESRLVACFFHTAHMFSLRHLSH